MPCPAFVLWQLNDIELYGSFLRKFTSLGNQEASLLHIVNNDCFEMLVQYVVEGRAKS